MDQDKGLYQNGFFVLKNHVTRMTAVSMSMIALMFLFALISQLIGMNYEIRYRAIWTEESLLTKEWAFLIVGALLFCAVVFPFELGIRRWFYGVSVGKEWPLRYIFSMFDTPRMYRKALWLRLSLGMKKLFWYIVCLLPSFLVKGLLEVLSYPGNALLGTLYGMLYVIWILFMIGGFVLAFYLNLKYYLVYYLWFETPSLKMSEAVRLSARCMRGRRRKALTAYFALIPLVLASVLVFPIIALIPAAYILSSLQGREILELGQKDGKVCLD
ncbi:hypothetical protein [Massiliimalia timonensis]|uniref:DUF975 family protein n=1 Tax=Massiliimalia timonensis TaxID=1987501 RepID=A0A8J6TTE1_9FIRM|nr:hypothetical protein [Massiliimalia timonensis]MBC8609733.1 hypothetical protein [Massiliimalia timonensis]